MPVHTGFTSHHCSFLARTRTPARHLLKQQQVLQDGAAARYDVVLRTLRKCWAWEAQAAPQPPVDYPVTAQARLSRSKVAKIVYFGRQRPCLHCHCRRR